MQNRFQIPNGQKSLDRNKYKYINIEIEFLDMVSKMPDLHPNLRRKKCKKRKFFIVNFFLYYLA